MFSSCSLWFTRSEISVCLLISLTSVSSSALRSSSYLFGSHNFSQQRDHRRIETEQEYVCNQSARSNSLNSPSFVRGYFCFVDQLGIEEFLSLKKHLPKSVVTYMPTLRIQNVSLTEEYLKSSCDKWMSSWVYFAFNPPAMRLTIYQRDS